MDLKEVLDEFVGVINGIYGVYLDSGHGFMLNKKEMIDLQKEAVINGGPTIETQDLKPIRYDAVETKTLPTRYTLHESTQLEYKLRNARNGANYAILANMSVAQIYSYWEDHYRMEIAKSLTMKQKNDIKSDLFGDIGHLRQSIIHHRSIAIDKISKCKILKWFNPGDKIEMNEYKFEEIVGLVKQEIDMIFNRYSTGK